MSVKFVNSAEGSELCHFCYLRTPVGILKVETNSVALTGISIGNNIVGEDIFNAHTPLLAKVCTQLEEYFAGKRKEFDFAVAPKGTEFQRKVWKALIEIPHGETRSYKDIAEIIGSPKSCRAVGGANNKNPIMIIVPCHRVIGADGSLTGYAGGLELKRYLLKLEEGGYRIG